MYMSHLKRTNHILHAEHYTDQEVYLRSGALFSHEARFAGALCSGFKVTLACIQGITAMVCGGCAAVCMQF